MKKTKMEINLWQAIMQRFGGINITKLSRKTGMSHTTLWRRFRYGGMTCREFSSVEGLL